MSAAVDSQFKSLWLAALHATPSLTPIDRRAGEWLAENLGTGTAVPVTWLQFKTGAKLDHHRAGGAVANLARADLMGQRERTGPGAGFVLQLPKSQREPVAPTAGAETRTGIEARNARRAAAQRAADLRADAKWLAGK